MKKILLLLFIMSVFVNKNFALPFTTENDSTEIYLIDSYVAPEKPGIFHISFVTSVPAKSKLYLYLSPLTRGYDLDVDAVSNEGLIKIQLFDKVADSEIEKFELFSKHALAKIESIKKISFV